MSRSAGARGAGVDGSSSRKASSMAMASPAMASSSTVAAIHMFRTASSSRLEVLPRSPEVVSSVYAETSSQLGAKPPCDDSVEERGAGGGAEKSVDRGSLGSAPLACCSLHFCRFRRCRPSTSDELKGFSVEEHLEEDAPFGRPRGCAPLTSFHSFATIPSEVIEAFQRKVFRPDATTRSCCVTLYVKRRTGRELRVARIAFGSRRDRCKSGANLTAIPRHMRRHGALAERGEQSRRGATDCDTRKAFPSATGARGGGSRSLSEGVSSDRSTISRPARANAAATARLWGMNDSSIFILASGRHQRTAN